MLNKYNKFIGVEVEVTQEEGQCEVSFVGRKLLINANLFFGKQMELGIDKVVPVFMVAESLQQMHRFLRWSDLGRTRRIRSLLLRIAPFQDKLVHPKHDGSG